jgi:large subunit ribosomal protein L35
MPKMKTHRGAKKRLKRTASGKLKRMRAYKSHILTKKTKKRKRRLRKPDLVFKGEAKRLHKILPYGT